MKKSIVLAGHHKCGTRWLVDTLQHSNNIEVITSRGVDDHIRNNKDAIAEKIRDSDRPVFIDYIYSICDTEALKLLKEIDPGMAGLVVYREPVDIILSMHNYQRWTYKNKRLVGYARSINVEKPVTDREFVESVENGVLNQQFFTIFDFERNAANLRTYFDEFIELKYENLVRDSHSFVESIFNFMGVEMDISVPSSRINPSIGVRSELLDRLIAKSFLAMTGMNSAHLYSRFKHNQLQNSVYRFLLSMNRKDPHFLSAKDRARLAKVFQRTVTEFRKISDLDVSDWGYE